MEKKSLRIIQKILLVLYSVLLVFTLAFRFWIWVSGSYLSIDSFIYWIVLVGVVLYLWVYKKGSGFTLKGAFIFFITGAVLTLINIKTVAEAIMVVSFILWLVGFAQALIEYKYSEKLKNN